MSRIPHFAGAQKLSLTDLQALADAVSAQDRVLPAAGLPNRIGSRKYGLANYSGDECSGTTVPDNPGLIESIEYQAVSSPCIEDGKIILPNSSGGGGCSCKPAEYGCDGSTLGLIRSIDPSPSITSPVIENGAIKLPCADSCRGVTGMVSGVEVIDGMLNPLLCYGLLYIPSADSCSGSMGLLKDVQETSASSPYISRGVLYLPSVCGGSCSCKPAEYNGSVSTLGLIRSVNASINVSNPDICNGEIRLPYAHSPASRLGLMRSVTVVDDITSPLICYGMLWLPLANGYSTADACGGSTVCGGNAGLISGIQQCAGLTSPMICAGVINLPVSSSSLLGVRDSYGNAIPWASVSDTLLSTHYVGSYKYDLKGTYSDGYLCLQIIQDYSA